MKNKAIIMSIENEVLALYNKQKPAKSDCRKIRRVKKRNLIDFKKLLNYSIEHVINPVPLDDEDIDKFLKDFKGSKAELKDNLSLILQFLRKYTVDNISIIEIEKDFLKMEISKFFTDFKEIYSKFLPNLKEVYCERFIYFSNIPQTVDWKINYPLKVSLGREYDELTINFDISYLSPTGSHENKINFESRISEFEHIVSRFNLALKEAKKLAKKMKK